MASPRITVVNSNSSNSSAPPFPTWRRHPSQRIQQQTLSHGSSCLRACESSVITLTAVWPKSVCPLSMPHRTPNTPPMPLLRRDLPNPDLRLYERKSQGPWPLQSTHNKAVGQGKCPPPLSSQLSALHGQTSCQAEVQAEQAPLRDTRWAQAMTAAGTVVRELGSSTPLTQSPYCSNMPNNATKLEQTSRARLQRDSSNTTPPSKASNSVPVQSRPLQTQPIPLPHHAKESPRSVPSSKLAPTEVPNCLSRQSTSWQRQQLLTASSKKHNSLSKRQKQSFKQLKTSTTACGLPPHTQLPHPIPRAQLFANFGIDLNVLRASVRQDIEDQIATMVGNIKDIVKSALKQQEAETTLHDESDPLLPAADQADVDVDMPRSGSGKKRLRSSSPRRSPTPRCRTRSSSRKEAQAQSSRSRSPRVIPEVKGQLKGIVETHVTQSDVLRQFAESLGRKKMKEQPLPLWRRSRFYHSPIYKHLL